MQIQIESLKKQFDLLQKKYGDKGFCPIYGAGKINRPNLIFVFMNPTGRNCSSNPHWKGIRAPWIGTKQIWKLFFELNLISNEIFNQICIMKPTDWDYDFSLKLYTYLATKKVYITNLAKCTLSNARSLKNSVFKNYLNLFFEEIRLINPRKVISFGNQVSSTILNKKISVKNYYGQVYESILVNNKKVKIYPTYYPVGQGRRNLRKAIQRIFSIISNR